MRMWMWVVAGCSPEVVEGAFEGPGIDPETGAMNVEGDLLLALTHLQVKNAPGPGKTFGDHANAVGTYLFTEEPPGWLGAGFRNVGKLNWWTMTVWTDEDAELDFVVSEPHASAMLDFADIVVGGESRSVVLPASELPMDWDGALDLLLEDQDFLFGDSEWFRKGGEL